MALSAYETLVLLWEQLTKSIPELSHYINLGIGKIMEYMAKGCKSRIYALAMSKSSRARCLLLFIINVFALVLNPTTKMKWIEEHWSASECADARKWMEEAVSLLPYFDKIINDMCALYRCSLIVEQGALQVLEL
jgi:hypothetical protein